LKELEEYAKSLDLDYLKIRAAYPYGSKVYGTEVDGSDNDLIIVYGDTMVEKHHRYSTIADATVYSARGFLNALADHEHSALECMYLNNHKSHSHGFCPDVKINLPTLRRSFSSRAARSFCKTEKKLSVLNDIDVKAAKKSLFHSLRILISYTFQKG